MIQMSLTNAANAVESNFNGKDIIFSGCSTDSRTLEAGNLFIALKGERFDGHEYISAAEEKGASSLILEKDTSCSLPYLKVSDARKAMGLLAQSWREVVNIPLVAITGSNGKTTVKEMVTSILSNDAEVLATQGNLNNDIGVPLTLFGLNKDHQYAVIEMGANHLGEIEWLSAIARPNVAVITQCAPAHLEGFGSIEGVAKAKSEIYSGLTANGTAIINLDDDFAAFWRDVCRNKQQMTFGIDAKQADVRAANIKLNTDIASVDFQLCHQTDSIDVCLPLSGKHNVMNALAAAACCLSLGLSLEFIKSGLEKMQAVQGRLQLKQGKQSARIIDDSYNANPTSLKAAINVLKNYQGKRYLVLGDMGELGDTSIELHSDAGKLAKAAGIDGLYTIGTLSMHANQNFGDGAFHFDSYDALNKSMNKLLNNETTVLVKGSRSMHMEKIVDALIEENV